MNVFLHGSRAVRQRLSRRGAELGAQPCTVWCMAQMIDGRDGRSWLNAPVVSALSEFRPVRSVDTYMSRLQRWGQVRRRKPLGGMILNRISQRVRELLLWLKRTSK